MPYRKLTDEERAKIKGYVPLSMVLKRAALCLLLLGALILVSKRCDGQALRVKRVGVDISQMRIKPLANWKLDKSLPCQLYV